MQSVRITSYELLLNGTVLGEEHIAGWVVEQDLNQPDMFVLTLHDPEHAHSNQLALGDSLELKVEDADDDERVLLFAGEIVGLEPNFKAGGESVCVVRAFNRLHRLLRGRHSRTFTKQTDSDIATLIAGEHGLGIEADSTATQHEHVYQHNQTDFDFLRARAAHVGYEVMVEKQTLHFRKPRPDKDSGLELELAEPGVPMPMLSFSPRLSSAGLVNQVEVRGWDPVKKEEIVATSKGSRSPLGKSTGFDKAKQAFGATVTYQVDVPVESVAEAQALADARFRELAMDFITGDALCLGHPRLKAGLIVKLIANPENRNDRFNGKYQIAGATHRYAHAQGGGQKGGYTTTLRVRRDAEGG
jgi:uncharacterized protein